MVVDCWLMDASSSSIHICSVCFMQTKCLMGQTLMWSLLYPDQLDHPIHKWLSQHYFIPSLLHSLLMAVKPLQLTPLGGSNVITRFAVMAMTKITVTLGTHAVCLSRTQNRKMVNIVPLGLSCLTISNSPVSPSATAKCPYLYILTLCCLLPIKNG